MMMMIYLICEAFSQPGGIAMILHGNSLCFGAGFPFISLKV